MKLRVPTDDEVLATFAIAPDGRATEGTFWAFLSEYPERGIATALRRMVASGVLTKETFQGLGYFRRAK